MMTLVIRSHFGSSTIICRSLRPRYITAAMSQWDELAENQSRWDWCQVAENQSSCDWWGDWPEETRQVLANKVAEMENALKEERAKRNKLENKVVDVEILLAAVTAEREQLMAQLRFSQQQHEATIAGVKKCFTHFCNVAQFNKLRCPHKLPGLVATPCPTIAGPMQRLPSFLSQVPACMDRASLTLVDPCRGVTPH